MVIGVLYSAACIGNLGSYTEEGQKLRSGRLVLPVADNIFEPTCANCMVGSYA